MRPAEFLIMEEIDELNRRIVSCRRCPRLVGYLNDVAAKKVRRFRDQEYWGRPLAGYGDANCRVLIVGLAPAAHGGTRTGRMFTGDSSADWLARALYRNGFATQPTSESPGDGYRLTGAYVTAAARCAPPQNRPTREELDNCSGYLRAELRILRNVRIIVCLGRVAFDSLRRIEGISGERFSHGHEFMHRDRTVICSYHPSRQNTNTGRLAWRDWNAVFRRARRLADKQKG